MISINGSLTLSERSLAIRHTSSNILNDRWLDLFIDYNVSLSVSLDGPDVDANVYRLSQDGAKAQFEKILKGCRRIIDKNLPLVVFCVVHNFNVNRTADLYRFFRDLPAQTVSFTPCYLPGNPHGTNISPDRYATFLEEMLILRDADTSMSRNISFGVLDHLRNFARTGVSRLCFASGRCHEFININASGIVFSTCTDALGFQLGNLVDGNFSSMTDRARKCHDERVIALLGGMPDGLGCPKYAHGGHDEYLDAVLSRLRTNTQI